MECMRAKRIRCCKEIWPPVKQNIFPCKKWQAWELWEDVYTFSLQIFLTFICFRLLLRLAKKHVNITDTSIIFCVWHFWVIFDHIVKWHYSVNGFCSLSPSVLTACPCLALVKIPVRRAYQRFLIEVWVRTASWYTC